MGSNPARYSASQRDGLAADDVPRVDIEIDGEGDVDEALPGRDVREGRRATCSAQATGAVAGAAPLRALGGPCRALGASVSAVWSPRDPERCACRRARPGKSIYSTGYLDKRSAASTWLCVGAAAKDMLNPPPFKLASAALASAGPPAPKLSAGDRCCKADEAADDALPLGRTRLGDLNQHIHCSVLGTCLSTAELRKLMARFIDVQGASDLEVHHEAVRRVGDDGRIAKALHKALDKRHEAAVQRFSRTRDPRELEALWDEALRLGDIPGAYWAVLTHRNVSADLRQRVFGDVHMLSHLVGAANRADIRRLVALEKENADLHERLERQHTRSQQLLEERDAALAQVQRHIALATARQVRDDAQRPPETDIDVEALTAMVAAQTDRRERAEGAAAAASTDAQRLQRELDHTREQAHALGRELAAAELQLRGPSEAGSDGNAADALASNLKDRRILYVGGRPSTTPAIRDLVQRHGGEFQKHDGGLEDRKGLLESSVAWAEFVLFPVDCIDHDSAGRLKRLCTRLGTPFVPLRSASVASFAAAISELDDTRSLGAEARRSSLCLRHG